MKIQCDVCSKEEASVFCSADEAALCVCCDRRVHHANKLASKHIRFSLQLSSSSSSEESPRCDICQEKRANLFCQEDRAMLCTECDIPIHKANELKEKHNRFLLTGARLSASSSSNVGDFATDSPIKSSVSYKLSKPSLYHKGPSPSPSSHCRADMDCCPSQEDSVSLSNTSSISEYLMETLPGWRVDDLLDPSCSHPGICKVCSKLDTLITRTQTAHNTCTMGNEFHRSRIMYRTRALLAVDNLGMREKFIEITRQVYPPTLKGYKCVENVY